MVNFVDSMNQGLQAADKLVADEREIGALIDLASSQIAAATDGIVSLGIREFEVAIPNIAVPGTNRLAGLMGIDLPKAPGLALIADLKSAKSSPVSYRVAGWTTSRGGYPIKLSVDGSEISCFDKEALETGLAKVLASPTTGQRLRDILNKAGITGSITPKPQLRRPRSP